MITWEIKNLQRRPEDNFVVSAFWEAVKENNGYGGRVAGMTEWEGQPLIPYDNLSEEIVLDWIKNKVDIEKIENQLNQQINEKIAPILKSGIPWLSAGG